MSGWRFGNWVCCGMLLAWAGAAARAEENPRRFALVVGVRQYLNSEHLTPLAYTEPDATEIAATLKDGGFSITLLTQTEARAEGRERFAPNAAFIRKHFADMVGTPFLKPDDCLLVVLGGHGIQLPARENAKQFTFYFCPADASIEGLEHAEDVRDRHNLIPVEELYQTLSRSQAGVKLLVVDACRNDPNQPNPFRSANSVTRPPLPLPPGGMAALFSCSASQRAVEDPALKHGVFSHFLIQGLGGKADLNKDNQISINELNEYVGFQTFTYVREKYQLQQLPDFSGKIVGFAPLVTLKSNSTEVVTTPMSLPEPMPIPEPPPETRPESKPKPAAPVRPPGIDPSKLRQLEEDLETRVANKGYTRIIHARLMQRLKNYNSVSTVDQGLLAAAEKLAQGTLSGQLFVNYVKTSAPELVR